MKKPPSHYGLFRMRIKGEDEGTTRNIHKFVCKKCRKTLKNRDLVLWWGRVDTPACRYYYHVRCCDVKHETAMLILAGLQPRPGRHFARKTLARYMRT